MRLLNYIREHRHDPREDLLVVIISNFGDVDLPSATVGNTVIRQEVDEAFSQFEVRVRTAARSMRVVPVLSRTAHVGISRQRSTRSRRLDGSRS